MENKKIGIFGVPSDKEVDAVKGALEKKGAQVYIFDQSIFPAQTKAIYDGKRFLWGGVDLLSIDAFYGRTIPYFWPIPQEKLSSEQWEAYYDTFINYLSEQREMLSLKFSLIEALASRRPFINHPSTHALHRLKVQQYALLEKEGFKVPAYIASNNLEHLKNFIEKNGGLVLGKTLAGYSYVSLLKRGDLDAQAKLLLKRPLMLQRYIKGHNIRVYCIGDEFVASANIMHSSATVDSRLGFTGAEVFEVPDKIKEISVRAMKALGMVFSGIDFLYCPDEDEYYLLECNSSPMFVNYSKITGFDITQMLADYLLL